MYFLHNIESGILPRKIDNQPLFFTQSCLLRFPYISELFHGFPRQLNDPKSSCVWLYKISLEIKRNRYSTVKCIYIRYRTGCDGGYVTWKRVFLWNVCNFGIISVIDGWSIFSVIALIWMSQNVTRDRSTLVQVTAWCHHEQPFNVWTSAHWQNLVRVVP